MERRKEDPVIVAIHSRLDKLEDISGDLREIKEWIATVVKVTRGLEVVGCFMSRMVVVCVKVTAGVAILWAAVKFGMAEALAWVRGLFMR